VHRRQVAYAESEGASEAEKTHEAHGSRYAIQRGMIQKGEGQVRDRRRFTQFMQAP